MARLPRFSLPDLPHLVVQRGNNRQLIAHDDEDRSAFMTQLRHALQRHRVAMHAYTLLSDQVQLLLTPTDALGVGAVMQDVGRAYVRQFNRRHQRTGTLWEGRYRSCIVQPGDRLMKTMVAIDTAAVRADLVTQPGEYLWDGAGQGLGLRSDLSITLPACYWELGNTPFSREAAYAQALQIGTNESWLHLLTRALQSGWPVGDSDFIASLQNDTDRRLQPGRAGRPKKSTSAQ